MTMFLITLVVQGQMILGVGVAQKTAIIEGTTYTKDSPLIFTAAALYGGWIINDTYQIKASAVTDMNIDNVTGYGRYTSYRVYGGFDCIKKTNLAFSPTLTIGGSNLILDDYNKIFYEFMLGAEFLMERELFDLGTWGIAISYFDGLNMDNCLRTYEFHSTIYFNINF